MATHDIPGDCTRVNLMVLEREKEILGQSAFAKGYRSTSEFIRHLIDLGFEAEDKRLAEKYKAARAKRYSNAVVMVFTVSIITWQSVFADVDPRRRSKPTPRRARIVNRIEA